MDKNEVYVEYAEMSVFFIMSHFVKHDIKQFNITFRLYAYMS